MNNRRRAILIIVSVISGTLLSGWLLVSKRGALDNHDYFLLATNLIISLILIFGVGYILVWRKKD